MMSAGGSAVWRLTLAEFAATEAKVAAINARAIARGFTGRIEVTGERKTIETTDAAGLPRECVVMETTITGEAPRYSGWEFLAAVDSVETETGTEFVIRCAPGVEEANIDRAELRAGHCAHCEVTRKNRRYTYLVRHVETGQTKQIGSTCVRDFTGWDGRPVFIDTEKAEDELRSAHGSAGRDDYTPATIVLLAWIISRLHGWQAGGGTRSQVEGYLYGRSKADTALREEVAAALDEDTAQMGERIVSELLDGLDETSNYTANLLTCLRAGVVEPKHMGIVVSAVAAYERMTATKKAPAAREKRETAYAGTVGEKITLTGTVTRVREFESAYGYGTKVSLLVIVEAGPTVAKMFTSAAWADDVDEGETVTIAGTIKAHEDYRGVKQTVLTRPKRIT